MEFDEGNEDEAAHGLAGQLTRRAGAIHPWDRRKPEIRWREARVAGFRRTVREDAAAAAGR